jgi:predicted Zn finger-like uncharacterized protein
VYLTCPRCRTVYAVRAAMLREGQGEVRCGACRSVFNALDYLSDELPADGEPAQPRGEGASSSTAGARPSALTPTAMPEVLREDLQRLEAPPAARHAGLWMAAVALLLALGLQYLWFAPEDLARRFPWVAAPVQRFCLQAGCMVRAERAPERIRMISRDVRVHPRYEGALLVTATFSNTAPWPQPFPWLRFRLYDVNGEVIAARVFDPAQYLTGVLPADAPLPPGQPVQVSLEMLAPEEAAVSFEFDFL